MLRDLLITRRVLGTVLVLVAAGGAALALWPLGGRSPGPVLPTAAAARGDVVVTVGGLGRIVEGRASQIAVPAPATSAGAAQGGASVVSPDSVFPQATGHLGTFLVAPGDHVVRGQVLAVLDDGGVAAAALQQARSDLSTARIELLQKRTSDPSRGAPATAAELASARLSVRSAQDRLRLLLHPGRIDVGAARLEVRKAQADLEALTRPAGSAALAAAQASLDVATQRLSAATGPATQIDVTAARLEVAKAQADLDGLRAAPPAPVAAAIDAAKLAVTLAEQRIAELPPGSPASDVTAAQLELKKAQGDLDTLQRAAPAAGANALAAAQLAVDLASQRLGQLTGPPNPAAVAAVALDVKKAAADLEALQRRAAATSVAAGRLAIVLAHARLTQVLHPSTSARDAARADVAKALAELDVLHRRGGPGTPLDIEVAQLKEQSAAARVALAQVQTDRLTVHAPASGTVTALLAVPGSPADPSTPLLEVADLKHLAVNVDLSEFDAAQVRRGLPALVSVDALGGRQLRGTVLFEALAGVNTGGVVTFPVRVGLDRPAGVRPGMNVSVRIVVAERRNVVNVPLEAVSRREGQRASVTVVSGGRTSRRTVVTGIADNKNIEIVRGLQAGERVLLGGVGG